MVEKANILVIDDEVGPRESLRMILKPYYNVYAAEKGAEAIEIITRVPIDLVTVDLKMPGLSGTKILEKVKRHDPEIEAIIITGYGSLDTAIEGLRLGAFDYIAKPFDVNHVLSLVRRALERRTARSKLRLIKSEFLTNVSHELRTPLSVVMGFVSLLLDQLFGNLTPEQHQILERVYKNSEELLDLIENVLTLTSLNAGELTIAEQDFDLGVMVRDSVRRYEKVLNKKGIELSIQSPPEGVRIVTDPAKLARIFQNLFDNAIKFTPQGKIAVKVGPAVSRETVQLEIVDTGVGIPEEQVEAVLEPLQQVDSSIRRQTSGLGLGLTVAHRLTGFLGGSLELKSRPREGTQVLLNIPRRAHPLEERASSGRA